MKHFIYISGFFFSSIFKMYSQADTVAPNYIGIRFGIGPTNISSNVIDDHSSQLGFSAGISFEHLQPGKMTWSVELMGDFRGYETEVDFRNAFGETVIKTSEPANVYYTYISVPVKIGFITQGQFYKYGNIGICPSFVKETEVVLPEIDVNKFPPEDEIVSYGVYYVPQENFDLSGLAEFGLGYAFTNNFQMYGGIRGQYSFTNMSKQYSGFPTDASTHHYGVSFNLGIRYRLVFNENPNNETGSGYQF